MNRRAEASASGVFDVARSGSVPSATICASVSTTVTIDDRHDQRERHVAARVLRLAGRDRDHLVAAEGEDEQQRACRQLAQRRQRGRSCRPPSRRRTVRRTMKRASGSSLPIVRALTTHALWRMPRTLMSASAAMMPSAAPSRGAPGRHRRPVEAERRDQHVDDRGPARDAREPLHPADFERREAAERGPRIEVRAAGRRRSGCRPPRTSARSASTRARRRRSGAGSSRRRSRRAPRASRRRRRR